MPRIALSLLVLLAAGACGRASETEPATHIPGAARQAITPRRGALQVTKECSKYSGLAGSYCTITSSSLDQIEVGSRVVYLTAANGTTLDSDVILDLPGPGNNAAFGHCSLSFVTGMGRCTFSGGTGKFTWFDASVDVTPPTDKVHWHWTGTFSFSPE